jgi:hypothetical protein
MCKKLSLVLAGLAACSSVTVRKVPWRGDYANWDNAKQREADAIEGQRYYAPWPHLVVTRPFPVDVDSCFVSATLTGGGRYASFDSGILQGLNARLPGPGREEPPLSSALDPDASPRGEAPGATGGTTPVPLSDFMSIEYLPNEREQYAVAVTPGLFPADAKAELANRSMAGTLESGAGALPALARGVLDDVGPRLERVLPSLSDASTPTVGAPEGTRVTVRVHAVRYARPGIYPLLHQDELQGALVESGGESGTRLGEADDTIPSCSPDLHWPAHLRVGSFVVQTYAERYLDVVSAPSGSVGAASVARDETTADTGGCPGTPAVASDLPRGPPGRLVVRVLPWAAVFIDGRMVGTTPFEPVDVPSGTHCLQFINDELHVKRSTTVEIRPGETSVVQQKLEL